MARAVVLLSGGLDSTTAAALARREGWALYGLTLRYGQVHAPSSRPRAASPLALGFARHVELDVDLRAFGGSSLIGDGAIPKDRARYEGDRSSNNPIAQSPNSPIPSTYVPARNTVFLSLALAWAEVLDAERIVIGVNALDYSGLSRLPARVHRGLRVSREPGDARGRRPGGRCEVWAPLQQLSKAGIIRLGLELGLDYGLTHSCYDPGPDGRPCGRCDSCQLRARGFAEAGVSDPLSFPR